jgi:hypothetical protein
VHEFESCFPRGTRPANPTKPDIEFGFAMGGRAMNERQIDSTPETADAVSGQGARRKFLKQSGKLAIAAPAAVLLLSAASRNASAQSNPYADLHTLP